MCDWQRACQCLPGTTRADEPPVAQQRGDDYHYTGHMRYTTLSCALLAILLVFPDSADAEEASDVAKQDNSPPPVMKAARIESDFVPDGDLAKAAWEKAQSVRVELALKDATKRQEISTPVRALWSEKYVYFAFECPYTKLTVFDPPQRTGKRLGLWDRDVVEMFIGADARNIRNYTEYEVSPTNERLDVKLNLPDKDFDWTSNFESAVKIDEQAKIWRAEIRIPISACAAHAPKSGDRWRLNLYRSDREHKVFLAWRPTLTASAHTPERFGVLVFE